MNERMEQATPDIFPDVVRIEPAGRCNFRCIHCPRGTEAHPGELLNAEQFAHIIDQFRDREAVPRVVVLYHGGEPLLNTNLPDYVQVLKEMGVSKVQIVTNGSLLTRHVSQALILAGIDEMHVSFDGESPDENNAIRRNGDFHKDALNVKEFYRIYKEVGFKKVRILVASVQLISHEEVPRERLTPPRYLTQYFRADCPEIEYQSIPAMVWPGFRAFEEYAVRVLPEQRPDYCGPLFETLTILANGDVVPCCYDLLGDVVFGNVFNNHIFDIWNTREYREFRASFRRRKYPALCRKCILISPRFLCRRPV